MISKSEGDAETKPAYAGLDSLLQQLSLPAIVEVAVQTVAGRITVGEDERLRRIHRRLAERLERLDIVADLEEERD